MKESGLRTSVQHGGNLFKANLLAGVSGVCGSTAGEGRAGVCPFPTVRGNDS